MIVETSVVVPFSLSLKTRAGGVLPVGVRAFRGVEELSRPYRFHVRGDAPADAASADELLGATASLSRVGPRGVASIVAGIVARASSTTHAGAEALVLKIVPRLWVLGRGKDTRIFQDQSVLDIAQAVLGASAIPFELRTTRSYVARPYCVQYQESDLTFLTRIFAEEGLVYWFRQPSAGDGSETLVIADAATAYQPIDGELTLPVQFGGALSTSEYVRELAWEDELRSGKTSIKGYDFSRPQFDVHGNATIAPPRRGMDETLLASYRHDDDVNEGIDDALASRWLDARRRKASFGRGASTCMALTPGRTFAVDGHARQALNATFAVVRIEHEATLGGTDAEARYENRFVCVEAGVIARPKRPIRKLSQTTETAVVVGPPGEEIYVDTFGRVKVQFSWDRQGKLDDKSSCWLRAMQPWAGASWGSQFIPRIGMEVVVGFLGGDVDRPMVLGAVYNGVNPLPYGLPASKTQSGIRTRSSPGGAGFNELRFEDAAGAEQLFVHAQKNLDTVVEQDHTRTVGHVETVRVGADRSTSIGGEHQRIVVGDEAITVGKSRTLQVAEDHVRVISGNEVITIGKDLVLHVKGKQTIQIDGQSSGQGPAPGQASAASPPAVAAPPGPAPGPAPADVVDQAKLLWLSEQVPADHYEAASSMRGLADAIGPTVTALEQENAGLAALLRPGGVSLAPTLARAVGSMLERAAALKQGIDAAVAQSAEGPAPLAPVHEALRNVTDGFKQRIGRVEQQGHALGEAASTLSRGLTGQGSGSGGGGANQPQWQKPDSDSSSLAITGDATITSTTILTLAVAGSSITITPSSIEIQAPAVTIESPAISVKGGVVLVTGMPIMLN